MRPNRENGYLPPVPQPHGSDLSATESVDLEDPEAVNRAIALHRAGLAVFAMPFGSAGAGTLSWLDPRAHDVRREKGDRHPGG
jgi:hypothetical protein